MNRQTRFTKQTKAVLDEMEKFRKAHLHPTAYEVYRSVKNRMPKISLATVYRNLEKLVEQGLISEVKFPDAPTYYNGNSEFHHHIMCVSCGKVDDISLKSLIRVKNKVTKISNYKVMSYKLELFGLCPVCQRKGRKSRDKTGG